MKRQVKMSLGHVLQSIHVDQKLHLYFVRN
jgi:hypothetical protein